LNRYFITLDYYGSAYSGWQIQPNAISVQESLQKALSTILRDKIAVVGCGRTDAGVHAKHFVAHAEWDNRIELESLKYKLNALLDWSIVVHSIVRVEADLHARFSATSRSYQYLISTKKTVFYKDKAWIFYGDLDLDKMNAACAVLMEHNDFESFSKVKTEVNNFICKIYSSKWEKRGDMFIFEISANRFLRNMVRAIVGTMVLVGQGKLSLEEFREVIASKNRSKAGVSAPAQGLFFTGVSYDDVKNNIDDRKKI